ncbi:MAG: sugar phosphate isomerase/epimerase family protein [Candidatus Omnitrophota bacterium]
MNTTQSATKNVVSRRDFAKWTIAAPALLGLSAALAEEKKSLKMYKNLGVGHIGVNADQKQAIEYAARFDFGGVSPSLGELEKMTPDQRNSVASYLKEKGLQFGASSLPVQFRTSENAFRQDMALLPKRAEILQSVGVSRISTWILPSHRDLTYIQNFEQHRARLSEVARILQNYGIRLGLEFVGPQTSLLANRFPFIHTQLEMMDLIGKIGCSNVGLLFDSWHWHSSKGTVDDLNLLTNLDIVEVHVNDAPQGLSLGELVDSSRDLPTATGVIDLKRFINFLYNISYDGPVTCEPFNKPLNEMDNEEALKTVSDRMNRLFALIDG